MNTRRGAWALVLAFGCSGLVPAVAQDDDHHDRQESHDRDHDGNQDRNLSSYYNNPNYQRGRNDAKHHHHKNKKWKNDTDRQAYEAGYAYGDRGERGQNPNR